MVYICLRVFGDREDYYIIVFFFLVFLLVIVGLIVFVVYELMIFM